MDLEFQRIVEDHALRYPAMEPQDFGKLAYQSEFGPEHLVTGREEVLEALLAEWGAMPGDGPAIPPEAIGNGLYRFHLGGGYDRRAGAALLVDLFADTARSHTGTRAGLESRLAVLRALDWPGMARWLEEYEGRGCPPVGHSAAFRAAYHPHYRVVSAPYACYFPALLAVSRLAAAGRRAVIAIDGRCGSGKTALAGLLRRKFSCNVFHMDDFYLPPEERAPDWETRPGGNMDLARFRREVLAPVLAGEEVAYCPFDCRSGRLGEPAAVPPRPLTVVEGSYAHHPALAAPYDLRIFLTCSREEQARRLEAREGEYAAVFQRRWIPMEERYLRACGIGDGGALTLDTGGFF